MLPTPTAAQRKAWIAAWRSASGTLERIRADEFRQASLATIAAQLDGLSQAWLRANAPGPTSGLVEQQRLFRRASRR